ncbi:AAA family ATPase [Acetatifactor aquisgranensis]|jgi:Predicted ATPase|uniref:AAA family ATPase n=1 Tax=Acetatifactor aquisgranensis TaxID=2941233 RepID=UPI00203FF39A|nr:AAA family ATPase [Acetatifactor aquisgranensis]MCI8542305.1 AAA family ATPase [Lachnospiraceae bacterium]
MIYLSQFSFPDIEREYDFLMGIKRTCYDSFYPFQVLSGHGLRMLDFEPITILYGGNGSGKTTALNVVAQKLGITRESVYNRSNFFEDYLKMCDFEMREPVSENSRIITSDDVFDFVLNLRCLNDGISQKREELFEEYLENKYSHFQMKSLEDYEQLKKVQMARRKTQSRYVRNNLMDNVREHSNGESAFLYFSEKIQENGLYLLDEPENSLSALRQQEFAKFLEDSARFFGCQFVISTHSPFLLAMRGAKIYDMDEDVVDVKRWTQLEGVRMYFDFFMKHEREFGQ